MSAVTLNEIRESFDIDISWPKTIAYVKTFTLTNGAGVKFKGRLYWDSNDGFSVYWETKAPEMAFQEDFLYELDSYSNDPEFIVPPYGDLSDAGMDGA